MSAIFKPTRWSGVLIVSVLTTFAAMIAAFELSWFIIPPERLPGGAYSTLIITPIIAFPFSFGIWSKVRENLLLSAQLQELVNHDRLTNVGTREYFFRHMGDTPEAIGISVMVDIDHFKRVNDTYGHFVGDEVIKQVAEILSKNTRSEDVVCRFGGEEFMIFLTDRTPAEGELIAERMRASVAAAGIETDAGTIGVTISIGGAEKHAHLSIDSAIKAADSALYEAKNTGRDRVVMTAGSRTAA